MGEHWYQTAKWDFEEALADADGRESILDVGCGPGVYLNMVRGKVSRAAGVEFNERARQVAAGDGLEVYRTFGDIPDGIAPFDAIFAFHLLEHVEDPEAFIRELLGLLAPGGVIGISVPNMEGPVRFIEPCFMNMPPHHATRWKPSTLKVLAAELGLSVRRLVCEPLSSRDRYYYTDHWVDYVNPFGRSAKSCLGVAANVYFGLLFGILSLIGETRTCLHKGQSVYVLLSREE